MLPLTAPTRLDYFASLVAQDEGLLLLEAAISVGQDADPGLDPQSVLVQIDTLGRRLRRRIPGDAAPLQRLRFLNRYFFDELAFGGNVNDYYDPANSLIHQVLDTRRGIPITLAMLYIELAGHAGLEARGIGFPGHFLVKVRMPRGEVVIDPFTGMSLSREELEERLAPFRREQGLTGDFEVPLGLFLQTSPARDILARLLRNLKEVHRSAGRYADWLAVQQRLVILLPTNALERRDRGLVLAEVGRYDEATGDLRHYLEQFPNADDAAALRHRVAEIEGLAGQGRRP